MDITNIADACAVLDYLHRRELLCQHCGDNMATVENAFHRRCEKCKSPNGQYSKARIPSELERVIVGALQRWVTSNPTSEGRGEA